MKTPTDYGHTKRQVVSWQNVKFWATGPTLLRRLADFAPTAICYIPTGGMVPAAILAHVLSELGVHCNLHPITSLLLDERIVIVDDIVDSGTTLKLIHANLLSSRQYIMVAVYVREGFDERPLSGLPLFLELSLVAPRDTWMEFPWELTCSSNNGTKEISKW